jgi:hypothetical protein
MRLCAALIVAACSLSSPALARPTVPPGFEIDTLSPRLDNVSPRLEAVRNPLYGSGVMTASVANGILTIRRMSLGNVETFAVVTGLANFVVNDLRFDVTGTFGGKLYASVSNEPSGESRIILIEPNGQTSLVGTIGDANDVLAMYFDFTPGTAGFAAGALLLDRNFADGSSVWRLSPPATFTRLAQNSLAAGRIDMDVNGLEFDLGGGFGGGLFTSEADINDSARGTIWRLSSALVWTPFLPEVSVGTRLFRDLAISPGGALGNFIYCTEAVGDAVVRVAPDASFSNFATGFSIPSESDLTLGGAGAASISISESGDLMYVSDFNGVYRIRQNTALPGPQIIAQVPSAPPGLKICGSSAINSMSVLFSEPVAFVPTDVEVRNVANALVPASVSGSGSAIMLIAFATPLQDNTYTITIQDTLRSVATAAALDGDRNGIAGADAVLTLAHMTSSACPGDADGSRSVNFLDITTVLANFGNTCP